MRRNTRESKTRKIDYTKRLGHPLGIFDRNNTELCFGDEVQYGRYQGILLYNYAYKEYGLALNGSMWYGENKYSIDSYGKWVAVPMDNGAKMELVKVGR